jgi:hypothetical protein
MTKWIKEALPNAYVLNCEVGNGLKDSVFMTMKEQVS